MPNAILLHQASLRTGSAIGPHSESRHSEKLLVTVNIREHSHRVANELGLQLWRFRD